MSLARRNIAFLWRQSATTVVTLAFVGLLIFQQLGGVLGQWQSLGVVEREMSADVVIGARSLTDQVIRPLSFSMTQNIGRTVGRNLI